MRSHWDFVQPLPWAEAKVCRDIAFIEDLDGPLSVTNDAENVLAYINQQWPQLTRVVYKDTEGEWWEIYWDQKIEFTARFRPWHGVVWDQLARTEQ